ncbi:hypothetical protein, partial [Nocardia wallacei]|uniref:hypothetical protein n=1 Tax=Nocardia wallacei TaxID=480035 RepID=UPI0024540EB6
GGGAGAVPPRRGGPPGGVAHSFPSTPPAAGALISFFAATCTPTLIMPTAGASALAAAVFLVTGAGFLGNPAVVAGAVVLGLDPALALVIVVCQLGGCLIGYGAATAWWPDIGRRLDTLTT